jgi:hypothetical protein
LFSNFSLFLHTQVSLNTMRYGGRDSASGIGNKLSIIRPGAPTVVHGCCSFIGRVNDHAKADGSNVQGEYNGVPGRREQPHQWFRTYDRIQQSNRPDPQKKQSSIVEPIIEPAEQPSSSNEFQNS